jgi:hypothetical protein
MSCSGFLLSMKQSVSRRAPSHEPSLIVLSLAHLNCTTHAGSASPVRFIHVECICECSLPGLAEGDLLQKRMLHACWTGAGLMLRMVGAHDCNRFVQLQ